MTKSYENTRETHVIMRIFIEKINQFSNSWYLLWLMKHFHVKRQDKRRLKAKKNVILLKNKLWLNFLSFYNWLKMLWYNLNKRKKKNFARNIENYKRVYFWLFRNNKHQNINCNFCKSFLTSSQNINIIQQCKSQYLINWIKNETIVKNNLWYECKMNESSTSFEAHAIICNWKS